MTLTPIETAALAGLVLLAGYGLRRRIALLARFNMPAPVIGGLAVAVAVLAARRAGLAVPRFDAAFQTPLMIAFFTNVGLGASLGVLRRGGPQVVLLLAVASAAAVVQGVVGAGVAVAFGRPPLFGVLNSVVTLSGGPATGLAFAPQFEAAGVAGAATVATATAMAGIVLAGLFGSPLATCLIERHRLDAPAGPRAAAVVAEPVPAGGDPDLVFTALKTVAIILACMALGGGVSALIRGADVTLPAYIGAMLVAAAVRNLDDATGWIRLSHPAVELAGAAALSLFLVMAMMTLDLSLLAGLALPLVVNLAVQLALMAALVVGPVWRLMGRDYDAAVTAGGFAGFMLGTTANAMAILRALADRYAPAPRAFLAVPLVGTVLLDFTNALIITAFLNIFC